MVKQHQNIDALAWVFKNVTWADIRAEAQQNGWDWYNSQSYTWLDFSFSQDYYTYTTAINGTSTWIYQQLLNEWSGLWLYNSTDGIANFGRGDITHTYIPNHIGSISYITPGESFGNNNANDTITLDGTDPQFNNTITFGVLYHDVNGTAFPIIKDVYGQYASYWDWYSTGVPGSDYTNFTNRPTPVSIDQLSFVLHFIVTPLPGQQNANATLKLDQIVGNWTVYAPRWSYFTC